MGISDGMQGSGGEVDCSVGTIVWVRRRNGSWWPGRILGPNELSSSHLMSPRSGTPVKLLGREDASVDWYNLEKSKRVKAFRCGEFDECIERAESSQGIPIKKREKYARREDAILHALELERELLEKKQLKFGTANCVSSKLPLKKEVGIAGSSGNDHFKLSNPKAQILSEELDFSDEESKDHALDSHRIENGKKKFLDDDKCETIPRMRGLKDLGLRIASKRKLSASADSDAHQKSFSVDNHVRVSHHGSRSSGGEDRVGNSKNSLSLKRKRTQGGLVEESLVKRRDRRRPLNQVLQSSAKLSVSNSLQFNGDAISISMDGEKDQSELLCRAKRSQYAYLPGQPKYGLDHTKIPSDHMQRLQSQHETDDCPLQKGSLIIDSTFSGSMDLEESDSSERDYLNPDMDEVAALSGAEPRDVDQGHLPTMDSGELDESAISGQMPYLRHHDQSASDVGVSKWQLKGKRNTRNLMKRPTEMDGNNSNGFMKGSRLGGKGTTLNHRALGGIYHASEELTYDYDDDDDVGHHSVDNQMLGYGSRRYRSILKTTFRDRGKSSNEILDSEGLAWDVNGSAAARKGYWDEAGECFNTVYVGHRPGRRKGSALVDVDLKVQTSYQGEHVPLVSLMSRLNGKAIIGHPIQIETLDDGSSDHLLSTSHDYGEEPTDMDGSTALTPVWRTARRTAMHRVPRPHPSKALDGGDEVAGPSHSDIECKPLYKKLYTKQSKRPPTDKKYSKKSHKKVNLSNQKTRTLSSIAIEQKFNGGKLKANLNGLIKPEEARSTTITCIPVKLAFSRLLEAVGKPPRTVSHSISANGNTEKTPS